MDEQSVFGLVSSDPSRIHAGDDLVQGGLVRQLHAEVAQTHGVRRRRRSALALPGIQSDVVMVAARRDEGHAELIHHAHDVEAEHAVIEVHGFVQVADVQVHVADARLGRDGQVELVILLEVAEQGVQVERFAPVAQAAVRTAGDVLAVLERPGPILGRLGVQLDAVAFEVVEVGGLGHDVVGGRVGIFQHEQTGDGARQFALVGK